MATDSNEFSTDSSETLTSAQLNIGTTAAAAGTISLSSTAGSGLVINSSPNVWGETPTVGINPKLLKQIEGISDSLGEIEQQLTQLNSKGDIAFAIDRLTEALTKEVN